MNSSRNNISKLVINDPSIKDFCLSVISIINTYILNEDLSVDLFNKIFEMNDYRNDKIIKSIENNSKVINKQFILENLYSFFLKGGNAMPFLENTMLLTVDGDFDCEFLINPNLNDNIFIAIRNYYFIGIIYLILDIIETYNHTIINSTKLIKLPMPERSIELNYTSVGKPQIYDSSLTTEIYANLKEFKIPEGCPFDIIINENVSYKANNSTYTSTNVALIKIRTRTTPIIDLIDIAFPSKLNNKIKLEWDIHNTEEFSSNGYTFHVADPFSVYVDQALSAKTNTRQNKINSRTRRAKKLLTEFHPNLKARKENYTRKHPTNARISQDILKSINNQRV